MRRPELRPPGAPPLRLFAGADQHSAGRSGFKETYQTPVKPVNTKQIPHNSTLHQFRTMRKHLTPSSPRLFSSVPLAPQKKVHNNNTPYRICTTDASTGHMTAAAHPARPAPASHATGATGFTGRKSVHRIRQGSRRRAVRGRRKKEDPHSNAAPLSVVFLTP